MVYDAYINTPGMGPDSLDDFKFIFVDGNVKGPSFVNCAFDKLDICSSTPDSTRPARLVVGSGCCLAFRAASSFLLSEIFEKA